MKRGAILALALSATTMIAAAPAAAVDAPEGANQPPTYGNCVAATAAIGQEGVEDYTIPVGQFTQVLKPLRSGRPDVEYSIACLIFTPPASDAPQYVGPDA